MLVVPPVRVGIRNNIDITILYTFYVPTPFVGIRDCNAHTG